MNLKDVHKKVAAIRAATGDAEVAHGLEDELYRKVLVQVAYPAQGIDGPTMKDLSRMARAALRTQRIPFTRHTS